MSVDAFIEFVRQILPGREQEFPPEHGHPDETAKLLWPLLAIASGAPDDGIATLAYDPRLEEAVDLHLIEWGRTRGDEPGEMSPGARRVLLERVKQMVVVTQLNVKAEEDMMVPPRRLREGERRIAAALLWLHRMELPFPLNHPMLQ